jgi:hypothetical protein
MYERWIPVLAAALGLLGGVGGALVGGWVANQGEQERFRSERAAERADFSRDTFVKFLAAAENWRFQGKTGEKVFAAEAEVTLLSSSPGLWKAARDITQAAQTTIPGGKGDKEYKRKRNRFIKLAQQEMDRTG